MTPSYNNILDARNIHIHNFLTSTYLLLNVLERFFFLNFVRPLLVVLWNYYLNHKRWKLQRKFGSKSKLECKNRKSALLHDAFVVTLLAAKAHVIQKKIENACALGSSTTGSWERDWWYILQTNMAHDGRKRRGRYKEYMRHHNPYKFKSARLAACRRSGRINLLKADKNPCPTICQSGNNDQEFDNCWMCADDSTFYCDVNSSEFSGEQCNTHRKQYILNQKRCLTSA